MVFLLESQISCRNIDRWQGDIPERHGWHAFISHIIFYKENTVDSRGRKVVFTLIHTSLLKCSWVGPSSLGEGLEIQCYFDIWHNTIISRLFDKCVFKTNIHCSLLLQVSNSSAIYWFPQPRLTLKKMIVLLEDSYSEI